MANKDNKQMSEYELEVDQEISHELVANEVRRQEVVENRKKLEHDLIASDNPWGYSPAGLESKSAAMAMLSTKSGLYARIPITCKGGCCPYSESCMLLKYDMAPEGEKCALETALIEKNLEGYKRDFDLDPSSSFVDFTYVKELINTDIMIERAQALLTQEGIAVEEVYTGSNERTGDDFFRKEVSKALEIYEKHCRRRDKILDNMLATRKAKAQMKQGDEKSIYDMIQENINMDYVIEEVPEEFQNEYNTNNDVDTDSNKEE